MKILMLVIILFFCSCNQKEIQVNETNSHIWVGAMVNDMKKGVISVHHDKPFRSLDSVNLSKASYLKLLDQIVSNNPTKYQGKNEWVIALSVNEVQYNINFITHPNGKSILKSIKDEINSSLGEDEKEKKIYLNKLLDHLLTVKINPSNKVNSILSPPK